MSECCPICGYEFVRGPGYLTGAMNSSYSLEIPVIAAGVHLRKFLLVPTWPLHWVLLVLCVAYLPLVSAVFRYSRLLFIHLDRCFDPDRAGDRNDLTRRWLHRILRRRPSRVTLLWLTAIVRRLSTEYPWTATRRTDPALGLEMLPPV
jgi:hypothetical protein